MYVNTSLTFHILIVRYDIRRTHVVGHKKHVTRSVTVNTQRRISGTPLTQYYDYFYCLNPVFLYIVVCF